MTVCYDLRFPELYRILAVRGATVITVPSAFTLDTGKDHWEVLLRARAIENQAFVVGANQVGEAPPALPLLRALRDRRPLGRRPGAGPRRGVLRRRRPRPRAPGARPRDAAVARQPPPGLIRVARGGARPMMAKAPPVDKRRQILDAGDPRVRAPGLSRLPGVGHRRRGRRRLRARLPLLQLQGRGSQRAVHRALVAAAGRDRGGRRPGDRRSREARRRRPLHRRLLPLRAGPDEGDHRRGDQGGELVRAHPSAGDPPRLRHDRQDRGRRPDEPARSARTSTPNSPRCGSTARSSSCCPAGCSS